MWTVTSTQSEESWFDDLISDVIQHEPEPLPPHDSKLGHVELHWHPVKSGLAYVAANPETGTPYDRYFAAEALALRLAAHGFKRAVCEYTYDHGDMHKQATWQDVWDDATKLVQSGAVHLNNNSQGLTTATVQSQTEPNKSYNVEIHRSDPANPNKIASQFCDCDWGQFMNLPRTRQWKKFQNRPCKHCVATNWLSQSVPKDEARAPGDQGEQGQMSLPGMPSGGEAPSSMGLMQNSPMPSPNAWFNQPGAPPNQWNQNAPQMQGMGDPGTQAPPPESVLPQFPMDPSLQPQLPPVNPASVPGQRPGPTPTNPLQYPGGTFSSVQWKMAAQQFNNGDLVQVKEEDVVNPGILQGRQEGGAVGPTTIPQNAICEVMGTDPLGLVNVMWTGGGFDPNGQKQPFGVTQWFWPSQLIARPDLKRPGPAIRRTY